MVRASTRFVDRGPRRPRSRRFYPHGYRSSNPDTVLLGLAAVAVCGVVLVAFLLAVAGRSTDLGVDTTPVRLTAPPSATYTPPPCFPLQQPAADRAHSAGCKALIGIENG